MQHDGRDPDAPGESRMCEDRVHGRRNFKGGGRVAYQAVCGRLQRKIEGIGPKVPSATTEIFNSSIFQIADSRREQNHSGFSYAAKSART